MTRTWPSLPLAETGTFLKAPNLKDHAKQQHPNFKPPVAVSQELMTALAMVDGIEAADLRIPQGRTYELWRYAQGLAVKCPTGWTLYVPLEGQVASRKETPVSSPRVAEERSFA